MNEYTLRGSNSTIFIFFIRSFHGSTLIGNILLLREQILPFKSRPPLESFVLPGSKQVVMKVAPLCDNGEEKSGGVTIYYKADAIIN